MKLLITSEYTRTKSPNRHILLNLADFLRANPARIKI